MTDPVTDQEAPIRVWDLPTRLFHWLLLAAVLALVITGNVGGNALDWHARLGVAAGSLVVFRLVWGLVGGRWSRFTSFVRSPSAVLRYLKGQSLPQDHAHVGHNPIGAFSVLALLAVLGLQVASGLISDDEIAFTGPLNSWVSSATAVWATGWHKGIGKGVLLGLIGLHVLAIVVYRLKGRNLIRPMVSGDAPAPADTPASLDGPRQRLLALALAVACGLLGWWVMSQAGVAAS